MYRYWVPFFLNVQILGAPFFNVQILGALFFNMFSLLNSGGTKHAVVFLNGVLL